MIGQIKLPKNYQDTHERHDMHPDGIKLLKLMFNDGEYICPHHNKYAYKSLLLEEVINSDSLTLIPPNPEHRSQVVSPSELSLVALNPIAKDAGRNDHSCTSFRNFLVELDSGPLDQQFAYIKHNKLPYSAAIFSGNKSIHFLISLDEDLPGIEAYRLMSQWVLRAMPLADKDTKNPSRSIRMPGHLRDTGKYQELREFKGKVKLSDLQTWLLERPHAKPIVQEKKPISELPSADRIPQWVRDKLVGGLAGKGQRNANWFAVACEYCLSGFSLDDTIGMLSDHFVEEHDFKRNEWVRAIESGFKHIENGKR
jgi:hypothetical protein